MGTTSHRTQSSYKQILKYRKKDLSVANYGIYVTMEFYMDLVMENRPGSFFGPF